MPLVSPSTYRPPRSLPGGHAQTIAPALLRRVPWITREDERLELPDGDFLDLHWAADRRDRLAILSHGLEGHAGAAYIQGMAAALRRRGWDVLAWNFRGCGREPNRLLPFYHSGATHDLDAVVRHAMAKHPARRIDFIGYSLGGNLTLKYLAERADDLPERFHRAVVFSVPCDLACSSRQLESWANGIYMRRFLAGLRQKIREKHPRFPEKLDLTGLDAIRTFREFDDRYTAPLHGFRDATDYWTRSSCKPLLPRLRTPSLMINAANDPFLGPACYPREEAAASDFFHLEIPAQGGHVGFPGTDLQGETWTEKRAAEFLGT